MNYDFPVSTADVYLQDGTIIPGKKAILRPDMNRVFNIASDQYKVIEHKEVLEMERFNESNTNQG